MPTQNKTPADSNTLRLDAVESLALKLIDEILRENVFEGHRDHVLSTSICQICHEKCRYFVNKPGKEYSLSFDIYGNRISASQPKEDMYDCPNCKRKFPTQRYALHLEKCLGLNGRKSSRRNNVQKYHDSETEPEDNSKSAQEYQPPYAASSQTRDQEKSRQKKRKRSNAGATQKSTNARASSASLGTTAPSAKPGSQIVNNTANLDSLTGRSIRSFTPDLHGGPVILQNEDSLSEDSEF